MTTIVTRTGKGSPLTHVEVDTNFTNLNTNKLEAGAIVLGSAATPSISFTGDTNTGIYSPGADQVAVATNGTEKLIVLSNGNVGIGTSSPAEKLSVNGNIDLPTVNTFIKGGGHNVIQVDATRTYVYGGTNGVQIRTADNASPLVDITNAGLVGIGTTSPGSPLTIESSAGNQVKITYPSVASYFLNATSGGDLAINKDGSEKARIDSSGRLLVGTTDGSGGVSKLVVQGASNGSAVGVAQISYNGLSSAVLAANTDIGYLRFTDQGSNSGVFAQITASTDGTTGAGDYPGRLVFSTTADGASSPTERMRIKANGELWSNISFVIGKAGSFTNYGGYLSYDAGADRLIVVNNSGGGSAGVGLAPGATAWSTYSDERLKTDLVSIDNGLEKVCSLRAVTGRYNTDPEGASRSFLIAQDVQAVLPEAVSAAADEDAFLDLRYTEVIPLLVAALKESKERIEQLEQRLTAAGIA